jgi:hypothetical protein
MAEDGLKKGEGKSAETQSKLQHVADASGYFFFPLTLGTHTVDISTLSQIPGQSSAGNALPVFIFFQLGHSSTVFGALPCLFFKALLFL